MARGNKRSPLDDLFDLLKLTPIWVGPLLAAAAFCLFQFLIPLLSPAKEGGFDVSALFLPMFSWLAAGAVLILWVMAELYKLFNRRLLDRQSGTASIRDLSWREFERLVAEAYRRRGYLAEVVGGASGDGGIDIRLTGAGETILVQCKQWRAYTVGVTIVRELLGVVVSEKATKGVLVTSGRFTHEARRFARNNPQVELLDGLEVAALVRGVKTTDVHGLAQDRIRSSPIPMSSPAAPRCPHATP